MNAVDAAVVGAVLAITGTVYAALGDSETLRQKLR